MQFYTDNETGYHEWGVGIVSGNKNLVGKPTSLVRVLRLSEFILREEGGRDTSMLIIKMKHGTLGTLTRV